MEKNTKYLPLDSSNPGVQGVQRLPSWRRPCELPQYSVCGFAVICYLQTLNA